MSVKLAVSLSAVYMRVAAISEVHGNLPALEAVRLIRAADPGIDIEATGGVNLDNVREIAETGVDVISIGALTHSAPGLDLSMLFETES